MKKLLFMGGIVAVVAVFLSCAGFPQPVEEANTLVIGSLILDFPDGFYDTSPRKFTMNVQLSFRNTTQQSRFDIYTNRGYFYFQSNGTDEYLLEEFQLLNQTIGNTRYSFSSGPLNMRITPSPNKVIYLGHIVFTYSAPDATMRRGRSTYYNYEMAVNIDWDKQGIRDYLMDHNGATWLDHELVEYGNR